MNLITPLGAIGSRSVFTSSKRWNRPSAPTRNVMAGKKASSELYAICWARPMQSSFMNSEKLRFSAASHSARLNRVGDRGARPARGPRSVAVDKAEAADPGFRVALTPAPEDQPRGRADPAGEQEAHTECTHRDRGQVGTQLALDVGRLTQTLAQGVRSVGELLTLRLDVAPDVVDRARVPTDCHRSSVPPS